MLSPAFQAEACGAQQLRQDPAASAAIQCPCAGIHVLFSIEVLFRILQEALVHCLTVGVDLVLQLLAVFRPDTSTRCHIETSDKGDVGAEWNGIQGVAISGAQRLRARMSRRSDCWEADGGACKTLRLLCQLLCRETISAIPQSQHSEGLKGFQGSGGFGFEFGVITSFSGLLYM